MNSHTTIHKGIGDSLRGFYTNYISRKFFVVFGTKNVDRTHERSSDPTAVLITDERKEHERFFTRRRVTTLALLAALVCTIGVVYVVLQNNKKSSIHEFVLEAPDPDVPPPPTPSLLGEFPKAAVVSNGYPCAEFGKEMLEKGGSAVDAAIATLLCDGAACLHNMGLGGGFVMTIYDRATRSANTLNARETAPAAATEDMFKSDPKSAQIGGLSIAVPGELRGYQAAWEKYGKLPWHVLFEPTIKLCEEGVPVNQHLARNIKDKEAEIRRSKTLRLTHSLRRAGIPAQPNVVKGLSAAGPSRGL